MATGSRPGLRVLVAEDSIASRQALTVLLKRFGPFELVQVNDGQAALHELQSGSFTLLLTDRDMPNVNGIELIRKARKDARLQQLPIILISSRTAKSNVLEALEAGASDYVIKPFDSDVMLHRIQYLMQAKSARPELATEKIEKLPNPVTQGAIDALLYPGKRMVGPSDTLTEDEFYDIMKTNIDQIESERQPQQGRVLEQGEIDALLTANENDSTHKESSNMSKKKTGAVRPTKPIITYDFKHPARVSKDQQRTLENLHANLSRTLASAFSTIQRSVVDVDIAFVDQTTYAEFIMSLSNPSCSYTFMMEPLGGPAIMDFSLPIAYAFIDRAYGGGGSHPPQEARVMTRLERDVMGRVVTRALTHLESNWEALLKVQISDTELETNPEFMQIASPSDTVILIAFEVNMAHASGLVNLCYPYFTLEPIMPYLNVETWASRHRGRRVPEQPAKNYEQCLRSVQANVTAVCGRGQISAHEIERLSVGDTLVLQTQKDDPSVVFVEDQPIFFAQNGKSERDQYAVRLLRTIPIERVHHHR